MSNMMFFYILLLSLITTLPAASSPTDCIEAIESAVSRFLFLGAGEVALNCSNDLVSHSLWASAKQYCKENEILAGSVVLTEDCLESHSQLIPYRQVLPQLTDDYLKGLPVVNFNNISQHKVWNTSILISQDLYGIAKRTNTVSLKLREIHERYGWALYGFWGGVLLIGIFNHAFTFLFHMRLSRQKADIEEEYSSQPGLSKNIPLIDPICHWIRAKVTLPAAFNTYHRRLFWHCTIPTRLETIVVLSYWALSVIIVAVSYDVFYPNLEYTKPYQVWQDLADRLGNLCLANLPFLWLFGGRNNIFQWVTGWKYSTFNVFHRNIARAVVIQAIIHATSNTIVRKHERYYSSFLQETWPRMGIVAVTSMSIIVFFSSVYFRKHYYEFFLLVHKIFIVLVPIALFYHVSIFDGKYNGYLWPLVAMWGFERSSRLIRLAYYNIHIRFSKQIVNTISTATYWPEMDVIKVEIIPSRKLSRCKPGHHYFLYQPLRWRGWESHPFTLGTWTPVSDSDASEKITSPQSGSSQGIVQYRKEPSEIILNATENILKREDVEIRSLPTGGVEYEGQSQYKLVFWIRPFSGWTQSLRDTCLKAPRSPVQVKLLLEGPYGQSHAIHNYDNVLYITGGTGISAAACYLTDHVYRSSKSPPDTRTKNITLLWTARQAELIQHVASHELAPILKLNEVRTSFFATSGHESLTPSEIQITRHKPDITEYIRRYVANAALESIPGIRTAILVCGPAAMADEARAAIQGLLNEGRRGVYYFEEAYGW